MMGWILFTRIAVMAVSTHCATDNSNNVANRNDASVTLTVNLKQFNDNTPTVQDYERNIVEGQVFFNPELVVKGEDKDIIDVLQYSIHSQSPGNFWKIDSQNGRISVNKGGAGIKFKDGDVLGSGGSRFNLEVRVTDGTHFITSKDINDNAPIFIPSYYEISINETTPGDTSILTITADDKTSANGILQYNVASGNIGDRFRLDKNTGVLFVSRGALFDYDVLRRYQLIAFANDQGQPQLSGNATIVINILDNNNKNPTIYPFLQEFTVSDNVTKGYLVGSIIAKDPDADAVLRFEFTDVKEAISDEGYVVDYNIYDFRDLFTVEAESGRIYVNKPLESRRTNIVSYGVIVKDITPQPVQTGPGTIVINVKPFNTQKPEFEPYPSPIYIDEEQPIII